VAEHLFIRVDSGSDQATVVALNEQGHLISGPESLPLDSVGSRVAGMQVTVLLPGSEIVTTLAEVPKISQARVRQMLPFVLEDEFASDIEDLHFAAGDRNAAGALHVAAIDRVRLGIWIDRLKAAGVSPRRICPETDGVPDTPGTVTLFIDAGRVLGRRPDGVAFAFDGLSLADLWLLLTAEAEDATDLDNVVLFIDAASHQAREAEIDQWRQGIANLNVKVLAEGCLPKLASTLVFENGANLLQGDFAPRSNLRTLARPWKAAAGFALAFLLISVLGKGAELIKLSRDQAQLTAEATSVCAESYASE